MTDAPLDTLIACPSCDAIYIVNAPPKGSRAVCARCHMVLISPKRKAGMIILSLALTTVLLLISAAVFPFLDLSVQGFENNASILDAVLAFNDGRLLLLALATAALILLIPALRAVLLFYVMFPVVLDRPPYPGAKRAFRWADLLKPWSMAEIFAIGCAVALVKITALANVAFGAAFWMFAVLVLVVLIKDRTLCKWTVWESLDR